jgi:hypothetical protein
VVFDVVIGVVVLALLIVRQLRTRQVNSSGWRIVVILAVLGVVQASQFLRTSHPDGGTYAALAGSLVLAAGFGALRASTVRLWTKDGQVWQKGNWLTALLWAIALGAHLGFDYLIAPGHGKQDIGTATVVLYLAVSFGIQRLIVDQRARRLVPSVPSAGFGTA